jgi:hypothetical protein
MAGGRWHGRNRANRDFLGRAVRFLVASGIRQFLDIGVPDDPGKFWVLAGVGRKP